MTVGTDLSSENLFPNHPHGVTIADADALKEALDWLHAHMHADDWRYWGVGHILFHNERDAVAFKLAWG